MPVGVSPQTSVLVASCRGDLHRFPHSSWRHFFAYSRMLVGSCRDDDCPGRLMSLSNGCARQRTAADHTVAGFEPTYADDLKLRPPPLGRQVQSSTKVSRESERKCNQRPNRVRGRTPRHNRHVAHVQPVRARNAEIFVDNGIAGDGGIIARLERHPQRPNCVMHRSPAETFATLAVPHFTLGSGSLTVEMKLGEDGVRHLVEHGEESEGQ